jgi:hypothetical protein
MKDFDTKWQACAARARQASARDDQAPLGFAGRVVARAARPEMPAVVQVCQRLVVRLLAGAVVVLILCASLEVPHLRDQHPLKPGIENTVAQLVWSL